MWVEGQLQACLFYDCADSSWGGRGATRGITSPQPRPCPAPPSTAHTHNSVASPVSYPPPSLRRPVSPSTSPPTLRNRLKSPHVSIFSSTCNHNQLHKSYLAPLLTLFPAYKNISKIYLKYLHWARSQKSYLHLYESFTQQVHIKHLRPARDQSYRGEQARHPGAPALMGSWSSHLVPSTEIKGLGQALLSPFQLFYSPLSALVPRRD